MSTRGQFALAVIVVALGIAAAGSLTNVRLAMHAALLTVMVVALWPLLIVTTVLAFLLALAIVASFGHGDVDTAPLFEVGDGVVRGGAWLSRRWAAFLARQRHPVVLGVPAGLVLGGGLAWIFLACVVVPGERRTVDALGRAHAELEQTYANAGSYPDEVEYTDGFGRPMHYRKRGTWKLASWTLTSDGYDGKPSGDDLCISGATKWASALHEVSQLAGVRGIRALSCPTGAPN